jgi:RimJ/RimL family protein N-acetyltransferase
VLRPFTDMDREPFYALNTHPLVVESLGSSPTRAESDAMLTRYGQELAREGWGFWAVEVKGGGAPAFAGTVGMVGMVGLHRVSPTLPCAPAVEVGWRLHPEQWGHGYATEAASASVDFGFNEAGLGEIVAFTTTVNTRSQAVMARIGMTRDRRGDFDHPALPEDSPLRRHVLYRISAPSASTTASTTGGSSSSAQVAPSVAP